MLRISIVADRQNDYKHLDMFFGEGGGRELDIQQLYFNTCCGYTFIYPRLEEEGGYCNRDCDYDCHYYSTLHNSVAGILLPTRISMATRLCKILYITLSSHIKVKITPAFSLHITLPIIPISLQILLILLLVYFFLPAQRERGVIVPSQPTLL